jgi:hypothetical protein
MNSGRVQDRTGDKTRINMPNYFCRTTLKHSSENIPKADG